MRNHNDRIDDRLAVKSALGVLAIGAALLASPSAHAQPMEKSALRKVAPAHGLPAVGKFKPTWCDEAGGDSSGKYGGAALGRMIESKHLWDNLKTSLESSCSDIEDPLFQEQVGYYMQRWVNETGATPRQVAEFLKLRMDAATWDAQATATCTTLEALTEGNERDIEFRKMERQMLGCGYGSSVDVPYHLMPPHALGLHTLWHFDRNAQIPSQLVTLNRLRSCIPTTDPTTPEVVRWAVCRLDVPHLDEQKLAGEIKAAGLNDYARITAEQAMATVKLEARLLDEKFLAIANKDPEWKAVLLDAPARGWKAWEAAYAAQQTAVDAAWAYEDKFYGPRVSAAKGCLAAVQDNIRLARLDRKGKTVEELMVAVTSGMGPLILEHLRACHAAEGNTTAAAMVELMIVWGQPVRGPRMAASVAVATAAAAVLADRPKFPITGQDVQIDTESPGAMGRGQHVLGYDGTAAEVKSITRKGDRVVITFKTVKWVEDEVRCTPTNRIVQWRPDGTARYAENCRATGRKVNRSTSERPIWTWANLVTGIKPGVFLQFQSLGNPIDDVFEGVVATVWTSKAQKQLISVMGVGAK